MILLLPQLHLKEVIIHITIYSRGSNEESIDNVSSVFLLLFPLFGFGGFSDAAAKVSLFNQQNQGVGIGSLSGVSCVIKKFLYSVSYLFGFFSERF